MVRAPPRGRFDVEAVELARWRRSDTPCGPARSPWADLRRRARHRPRPRIGDRWAGDLRKLREEAERDPKQERRLLKDAKGLGDVGVDIFFREAQIAWDELLPFADRHALTAATRLHLARDVAGIERLADGRKRFVRLVAALVRTELGDHYSAIRAAARR